MQSSELLKYINQPQLLDKQSVSELQKLVSEFPYFQPAHLLLSLASGRWDASVYQQSLKKTAIVATNRERLFNLLHQSEAVEQPEETVIQQPAASVAEPVATPVIEAPQQEIVPENVPEPEKPAEEVPPVVASPEETLEKEIEKQVVTAFVEKELLKTPELHHAPPKQEPENFVDWLALLKKNNGPAKPVETPVRTVKEEQVKPVKEEPPVGITTGDVQQQDDTQVKKQKHRAIIDKIIDSNPGLIRNKEEPKFFVADSRAKESLRENEHLVTETLAKIYAMQGNVNKAVRAYEILSLKFPQKSAYFATLIQKLKNNQ